MLITKTDIFGETASMEIPITADQLREIETRGTRLIQDVAPYLSADQREFLMTGLTPEKWDAMFKDD